MSDNEPELDQKWGCALPAAWLDHMRIRPAALRAVFDDMNADTGAGLQIFIGAAPFIVAAKYYGSLAQLTVQVPARKPPRLPRRVPNRKGRARPA